MKRLQKEEIVAQVADKLKRAQGIYLTEFSGMTVEQLSHLRTEFRKANIEYKVVKNTLIKKAMEQANISDKLFKGLKKTTGMVLSYDDPIAPAKILKKFAATNDKLKFKLASVDGTLFEAKQLDQVAGMLSKIENIGKLAGVINMTVASVPTVINAVIRDLVNVVDQVAKQKAA
jgi:large subunit ribosomal protein L10